MAVRRRLSIETGLESSVAEFRGIVEFSNEARELLLSQALYVFVPEIGTEEYVSQQFDTTGEVFLEQGEGYGHLVRIHRGCDGRGKPFLTPRQLKRTHPGRRLVKEGRREERRSGHLGRIAHAAGPDHRRDGHHGKAVVLEHP